MKAKLDVSAVMASYSTALRRLSAQTGRPQTEVLRGEAGIILKMCAGRTKVATQAATDKRSRRAMGRKFGLTTAGDVGGTTINLGIKSGKPIGRVWRRVSKSNGQRGKFLLIGQMPEKLNSVRWLKTKGGGTWGKYSSSITPVLAAIDNIKPYIERGRAAVGLARQSWIQIADALQIRIEEVVGGGTLSAQGIAKARAAIASNGNKYANGNAIQLTSAEKAQITLINSLPYGTAIGMDRVLLNVIAGRAKYFDTSYRKGAFDSARNVARAYPWMRVTAV